MLTKEEAEKTTMEEIVGLMLFGHADKEVRKTVSFDSPFGVIVIDIDDVTEDPTQGVTYRDGEVLTLGTLIGEVLQGYKELGRRALSAMDVGSHFMCGKTFYVTGKQDIRYPLPNHRDGRWSVNGTIKFQLP